ncbi:MAG: hypothetical protein JOZ43_00970, partial [Acidobacteriales bacterium]|nr:hypothetical protein [Terriglobales bacterium]
ERGQTTISQVMGKYGRRVEYFRFPFNDAGDTQAKYDAIQQYLKEHGLKTATCTADNDDWEFNRAYVLMLQRHDAAGAQRLRDAYLKHTAAKLDFAEQAMRQLFGREVPQVMLLHGNRLNADMMGAVLHIFEEQGFKFVHLEDAQEDLAYTTPAAVMPEGVMWQFRWAKGMGKKLDGSKDPEPPKWVLEYGKSR